jgi:hypothetical protein
MQDEQTDEAVEPTTEDESSETAGASQEQDVASAVDQQAAQSDGSAAEAEPEVPDDAGAKIAAAQEHIDNLNMDAEREAAERTQKQV